MAGPMSNNSKNQVFRRKAKFIDWKSKFLKWKSKIFEKKKPNKQTWFVIWKTKFFNVQCPIAKFFQNDKPSFSIKKPSFSNWWTLHLVFRSKNQVCQSAMSNNLVCQRAMSNNSKKQVFQNDKPSFSIEKSSFSIEKSSFSNYWKSLFLDRKTKFFNAQR